MCFLNRSIFQFWTWNILNKSIYFHNQNCILIYKWDMTRGMVQFKFFNSFSSKFVVKHFLKIPTFQIQEKWVEKVWKLNLIEVFNFVEVKSDDNNSQLWLNWNFLTDFISSSLLVIEIFYHKRNNFWTIKSKISTSWLILRSFCRSLIKRKYISLWK